MWAGYCRSTLRAGFPAPPVLGLVCCRSRVTSLAVNGGTEIQDWLVGTESSGFAGTIWIYTLQGPFLQWSWESAMQIKLVLKRNGLYSLSFYSVWKLKKKQLILALTAYNVGGSPFIAALVLCPLQMRMQWQNLLWPQQCLSACSSQPQLTPELTPAKTILLPSCRDWLELASFQLDQSSLVPGGRCSNHWAIRPAPPPVSLSCREPAFRQI